MLPTISKASAVLNRAGARITAIVGTMIMAIAFTILSCVALPDVIASHSVVLFIQWITQSFLQLVLLPVIIVGQNIQGAAAEARSVQTLADVERLLAISDAKTAAQHARTRAHVEKVAAK